MNVASLELCKQLYELSGWDGTKAGWTYILPMEPKDMRPETYDREFGTPSYNSNCPAYDLGYLLRKLEVADDNSIKPLLLQKSFGHTQWICSLPDVAREKADTPENAACKLAIELFNQGILKEDVNE